MTDSRINKNGQPRKPKPSAVDNLGEIWAQACQAAKQAREYRQRCERAMLEAGRRQREGATA